MKDGRINEMSSSDLGINAAVFDYSYIEVPYNWIDATGGTELLLSDDGYSTQTLPFSFPFYDSSFSTIYVGANGYLSFADSSPNDYSNDLIPSADADNAYLIAPFWDDLRAASGGGGGHIYVQSFGDYWVAEWLDIEHYSGGSNIVGTFEVILFSNGSITFQYDYISYTAGGYTIGLNYGDGATGNSLTVITTATNEYALLFKDPREHLFDFQLIFDDSIVISSISIPSTVTTGKSLPISCQISSFTGIYEVIALVQGQDFLTWGILTLYDDGLHGDSGSNDGIFGATLDTTGIPLGIYQIDIIIENINHTGKIYDNIASTEIIDTFWNRFGSWFLIIIGLSIIAIEAAFIVKYRPKDLKTKIKNLWEKPTAKWDAKTKETITPKAILKHKSGERPYNKGVFITTCPKCKANLSPTVIKRLELGYRVYCPTNNCYYPLFTVQSTSIPKESLPIPPKETIARPPPKEKVIPLPPKEKIQPKPSPETYIPSKPKYETSSLPPTKSLTTSKPEPPPITPPTKTQQQPAQTELKDLKQDTKPPIQKPVEEVPKPIGTQDKEVSLKRCPYCNQVLRESQIVLRRMGKTVFCGNCSREITS